MAICIPENVGKTLVDKATGERWLLGAVNKGDHTVVVQDERGQCHRRAWEYLERDFRLADELPAEDCSLAPLMKPEDLERIRALFPAPPAEVTARFNGDGSFTVMYEVDELPPEKVAAIQAIGPPPPGTKVTFATTRPYRGQRYTSVAVDECEDESPAAGGYDTGTASGGSFALQMGFLANEPPPAVDQAFLDQNEAEQRALVRRKACGCSALTVCWEHGNASSNGLFPKPYMGGGDDHRAKAQAVAASKEPELRFYSLGLQCVPPSKFIGINETIDPAPPPKAHRWDRYCAERCDSLGERRVNLRCLDCGARDAGMTCVPRPGWREEQEREVADIMSQADPAPRPPRFSPPEPSLSGLGAVGCRMVGRRR